MPRLLAATVIGEYILENKGKVTAVRALADRKSEDSYQATGKIGASFKASHQGSTLGQTAFPKFAKLTGETTVQEVDVDKTWNFDLKIWEWK